MAVVASSISLSRGLSGKEPFIGEHVWMHQTHGLVTGHFPTPKAWFDFGEERFVSLPVATRVEEKKRFSHLSKALRKTKIFEIETETEIHTVGNFKQLLVEGLNVIERIKPGTHSLMSANKGRTRRAIAKSPQDLYDRKHLAKHAEALESGFFVATNNRSDVCRSYLRQAADLAGLRWGENFKVTAVRG